MDDKSRIAEVRINPGTTFPGDITDSVTYHIEDQIGSSILRLSTTATVIDQEEYYPFGDASYRTFTYKRYRYVAKEKDAESGLYYYGARYYAAWTCRFISVDPKAADYAHLSPFNYASNNPVSEIDVDGMQNPNEGTSEKGGNPPVVNSPSKPVILDEVEVTATQPEYTKGYDVSGIIEQSYSELLHQYENSPLQTAAGGTPEAFRDALHDRVQREVIDQLKEMYISEQVGWKEYVPILGAYLKGKEYDKMGDTGMANLQYTVAAVDVVLTVTDVKLIQNVIKASTKAFAEGAAKNIVKETVTEGTKLLKPLGLGSTGRTEAANLTEKLAMEEIMTNPSEGKVLIESMKDASGRWSGWSKMSNKTAHGVEIHYNALWENGFIKAVDDFKFIGGK